MGECRRTVEQLTPYLDGLLSPSEQADVDRHLGDCSPCRRAAADARGGRTVLRQRAALLRHEPLPPGLRSRCEALTRAHAPVASWRRRVLPVFAVAVLVLATGLAVFSMATRRSDVLLAQQLTLDHMKCFHLFASAASPRMDAAVAEAILADRYDWDVHVPPSSPSAGVALLGARRCLYASGTIPHVMYRVNGHDMSLFVLEGEQRARADVTTLGYASRIWSRGATTYVLVASRAAGDLTPAVRYVMQQVH